MKITNKNYSYNRGRMPEITEDTLFKNCNFTQEKPHTKIFNSPFKINFKECNLINVTCPEGSEIMRCNNAQVVKTATGNPDRPFINLLHECGKCATFVKALRKKIKLGSWDGRLDKVKFDARRRRLPDVEAEDLLELVDENKLALAKWEVIKSQR